MAIHIHTGKGQDILSKTCKIQSLPFHIHSDGEAKISEYFETSVQKDSDLSKFRVI